MASKNDIFEYHPNDSIYQACREDINGTHKPSGDTVFTKLWTSTLEEINEMKNEYNNFMGRE